MVVALITFYAQCLRSCGFVKVVNSKLLATLVASVELLELLLGFAFAGKGKERYGGTEFGDSDLIEKRKIEVVCVRSASHLQLLPCCIPFNLGIVRATQLQTSAPQDVGPLSPCANKPCMSRVIGG